MYWAYELTYNHFQIRTVPQSKPQATIVPIPEKAAELEKNAQEKLSQSHLQQTQVTLKQININLLSIYLSACYMSDTLLST